MAEQLEDFDGWHRTKGNTQYPWDKWLNGKVWKFTRGVDFTGASSSFRASARNAGLQRDIKIRTRILDDGAVVVQALLDD